MLWNDLREYLKRLDELGELRVVHGATWEEDIGGISELMTERQGPALLFDNIQGYPKGYRVASNLFNTPKRNAIALGLVPDPSSNGLVQQWAAVMQDFHPISPLRVAKGAILENVQKETKIDLCEFPTPLWHESDGARYIGTGVCVIQRDPDTGFVNSGSYRVAIHDEKTCTIFIERDKHGDLIRRKYWDLGKRCPVVVSVGQEPILTALSGSGIYHTPKGVSEFEVAGYLHRSPYPVIEGACTGLPMPADGEIAIEGFIPSPKERLEPEGPFGEWTGYYAHGRRPETVIEVSAVYYRNNPIIFGSPPSRPLGGQNSARLGGDDLSTMAQLEKAGIVGIQRIFTLARPNLRVVSIRQMYAAHINDIVRILVPGGEQYSGHHIWVLVDDDIDVANPEEVLWAIASRCAPENSVSVIPGTAVWQLDPRIPVHQRSDPDGEHGRRPYVAHNLVINACRPFEWFENFPPVAVNGAGSRARIRQKWKELFV